MENPHHRLAFMSLQFIDVTLFEKKYTIRSWFGKKFFPILSFLASGLSSLRQARRRHQHHDGGGLWRNVNYVELQCTAVGWFALVKLKVSVQGFVAHGGYFATLCREVDFYEAFFFFIFTFQKEKANTFTLLIILIVKSLQIELHSTNLLLWPPICRNKCVITPKCYNS